MRSRMERYDNNQTIDKKEIALTRSEKNQNLYDNFYTNSTYTEYQDVSSKPVDLQTLNKSYHTREEYQKIKEYQNVITPPQVKRDLEKFESLYPTDENKIYDINNVLETAKKNRQNTDELEKKRKLRSTQYNILANLDLAQLEQYREKKKNSRELDRSEEEEIQELIDTITSKSLKKQLDEVKDQDLMSDLLPSSGDETVITDTLNEKIVEAEEQKELNQVDQSFYTKSMDLSEQDFELDQEFEDLNQKKVPVLLKIILFLLLIGVMGTIVYFVIQNV